MPPAPISRSSTYLPKIWGNIVRVVAFSAPCALSGCGPGEPEVVTRAIRVYSLPACPASASAELELTALGEFPPTNATAEVLPLGSAARTLAFPEATRAVAASARAGAETYLGYDELATGRDVDLVLWPEARSCRLFEGALAAGFPSSGGGQALGYAPSHGLVLAAGGNNPKSSAVVGALVFDVRAGSAFAVDAARRHVLGEPRAFATVTEFGAGLLVAGGEDPIHDVAEEARVLRGTAEVYEPGARRFDPELVSLREARSRHAAIVLPSGETLLVGGRGAFGTALPTLEAIDPATRLSNIGGLATLSVGRIEPALLRLDDGRLVVAGGYDADGRAVAEIEWLASDASAALAVAAPVPARFDRAFVAMPGGGLLAVGGCEDREPEAGEDCASACRRGCPPRAYDAYWIDREGQAVELELDGVAPRPLLLPGSDGAPWLFLEGASGGVEVLRFIPFRARFDRRSGDLGELPELRSAVPAPVAVAPDHFVWIGAGEAPPLLGIRAGVRGRYAHDPALIVQPSALDPLSPAHLSPDRAYSAGLDYDGRLVFSGAAEKTVYVADARFADAVVTVEKQQGEAPELVFGAASCAFPGTGSGPETLVARRSGGTVLLSRGEETASCAVPAGEVSLGLRAREAIVASISIERGRVQ